MIKEIGIGDFWGPMGPGNTFLRNVVQGQGLFLYDHSHGQNFVGNTSTVWDDDGTSDNTLRHGETVIGESTLLNSAINDYNILASHCES